MPRATVITLTLLVEVRTRREAGEPWKLLAADLRGRGLPVDRATWWRAMRDVAQRLDDCGAGDGQSNPAA